MVTFSRIWGAVGEVNVISASDISRPGGRGGIGRVCMITASEIGQHLAGDHIPLEGFHLISLFLPPDLGVCLKCINDGS